jgi:acyl carrier protein
MTKLTNDQLAQVIKELFIVPVALTAESELSSYVKDSIDLGELIAVVKERYAVVPQDMQLFKTYSKLGDVAKIFNHEI